jgi:ABC-type Zn uptake system ZnuABC Zn-binding protein ZnuA
MRWSETERRGWGGVAVSWTVAALLAGGASACATDADSAAPGVLRIATTVAPITSTVEAIGGDRVAITGIVPEGADSHTFEPRPSVARLLSRVDVLFVNGLELEAPTERLAEQHLADDAELVELGTRSIAEADHIYDFSFPREGGKPNPHLWTDPVYVRGYAQIVRDVLSERDPRNAGYYARNHRRFAAAVARLDAAMRASFATVPRDRRKLLTYHDAYAYFGRHYGWDIVGALQLPDFTDPTPKQVARLIDQVERERVPAIFGSEVFPSPVLEQIGRDAGVRYVDVLRDDDLPGEPGDREHSLLALLRFNYVTITEAMGGDASALAAYEPPVVRSDRAEYPR